MYKFNSMQGDSMPRKLISTNAAPRAIGVYSQAIQTGRTVYLSGQIPLDPVSGEIVSEQIEQQIHQVFANLAAVAAAAGGSLTDAVKLNVYLTDLANFPVVNEVMAGVFQQPYPARATIGISSLPRGALVEIDAVLYLED
jgi:reactive intermediate/imine deaminase